MEAAHLSRRNFTMVRLTCRRILAVAIGALVCSASASAQQPLGSPIAAVPSTAPIAVSMPNDAGTAYKHNGHLATATRGFVMQSTGNYYCSNCQTGSACNNGAGSLSSDLGFAFGPTKSFFSPCGPRVLPDCGGKHGDCHKCRTPIYGRGPAGPWLHCTYDSYLNH
jgi:hypothetical protein